MAGIMPTAILIFAAIEGFGCWMQRHLIAACLVAP
jgi:hypothetical protein